MNAVADPIVVKNLDTIDAATRAEALRGWDWLASEAEKVMGERPAPENDRIAHWLTRLQEEGMRAFGLHAEMALAFFASVGHNDAVAAVIGNAMDENEPLNSRWVGRGAEHLVNDALRLAAQGCTDARAVVLLLHIQARGLPLNLAGEGGLTPLHAACVAGRLELVRALLACGADPNQTNDRGQSALHCLSMVPVWRDRLSTLEHRARIATDLIAAGAHLSQTDGSGITAEQALVAAGWPAAALAGVTGLHARQPRTHTPGSLRRQ